MNKIETLILLPLIIFGILFALDGFIQSYLSVPGVSAESLHYATDMSADPTQRIPFDLEDFKQRLLSAVLELYLDVWDIVRKPF